MGMTADKGGSLIRLIWTAAALVATVALTAISVAPPWDSEAEVEASGHSATREFAAPWVAPGGTMEVAITARDYGGLGRVIETLPEGFGYAGSTLPDSAVKVESDMLKFTLLGEERFAYTVTAPAVEGQYSFSGALLDANVVREEVGGDTLLRVGSEPTPTPEPTATHTPGPPATPTVAPEPAATHTPALSAASTPEPAATHTPEPAATQTPEPTATHTPQPTATHTPEPTATHTPQPTATHKPEPTATHTPVPTATPMPEPSATPEPEPTATPTPEPSATPLSLPIPTPVTTGGGSGGGSAAPLGIVVGLLILGALLLVGRAYMRFRASR